jgi:BASS family bile acid:Na+ symporter
MMLIVPALLGLGFWAFGIDGLVPALFLALVLQAAAPPITSAPAFAALMGLDAALSLAALVLCTVATPLTAPLFTHIFIGASLTLSATALGFELLLFLAGAAMLAAIIRWWFGREWVTAQNERVDGLSVIMLFVFAIAVMDGVAAHIASAPLLVIGLTALAFALSLGLVALTTLVFARAGIGRAFALGLAAGHRNMALMIAATGGALPELAWLYFGLAQFPIYLLPQLLKPLARRLGTGVSIPATPARKEV